MYVTGEKITSRANPFIKWASSLGEKKYRDESRSFIVEGVKLTFEAMEYGLPLTHIIVTEAALSKNGERLEVLLKSEKYKNCEVKLVSDEVFEKISSEKAPQGMISIIKYLDFFSKVDIIYKEEFFILPRQRALFLCSLRDPVNLGSVIRCAVAFGIEHIVLSSDCADVYNSRTIRCAMGSLFKVKITIVSNTAKFVTVARECGRRVLAAELSDDAITVSEVGLRADDIIIIGNEGHGIPKEISNLCDKSVYIPITENAESLNASCAAAVLMWEQSKIDF